MNKMSILQFLLIITSLLILHSSCINSVNKTISLQRLLNHTLSTSGGNDDDLDQLILSRLPEGVRLVLQSVKVYETDEDEDDVQEDVDKVPGLVSVEVVNASSRLNQDGPPISINNNRRSIQDQVVSGSHRQQQSKSSHNSSGGKSMRKKKKKNHYSGNDYGKLNKVTDTDTDGKTITNYKGKEDGLTDYKNEEKKEEAKEGERFRDTKKKNKGRRVQGFKRIYHKEEFQRTEHFYDDEDAKRVKESFGVKDKNEESKAGIKGDDRGYHGTRLELTDGKEKKKEKETTHGFKSGQNEKYEEEEGDKHGEKYEKNKSEKYYNHNNNKNKNHPSHRYNNDYLSAQHTNRREPPVKKQGGHYEYFTNFEPVVSPVNYVIDKVPVVEEWTSVNHPDSHADGSRDEPEEVKLKFSGGKMRLGGVTTKDKDSILTYSPPRDRKVKDEVRDPRNLQKSNNLLEPYSTLKKMKPYGNQHFIPSTNPVKSSGPRLIPLMEPGGVPFIPRVLRRKPNIVSNLMNQVRYKVVRNPGRFRHNHYYDTSRFPPNVVPLSRYNVTSLNPQGSNNNLKVEYVPMNYMNALMDSVAEFFGGRRGLSRRAIKT